MSGCGRRCGGPGSPKRIAKRWSGRLGRCWSSTVPSMMGNTWQTDWTPSMRIWPPGAERPGNSRTPPPGRRFGSSPGRSPGMCSQRAERRRAPTTTGATTTHCGSCGAGPYPWMRHTGARWTATADTSPSSSAATGGCGSRTAEHRWTWSTTSSPSGGRNCSQKTSAARRISSSAWRRWRRAWRRWRTTPLPGIWTGRWSMRQGTSWSGSMRRHRRSPPSRTGRSGGPRSGSGSSGRETGRPKNQRWTGKRPGIRRPSGRCGSTTRRPTSVCGRSTGRQTASCGTGRLLPSCGTLSDAMRRP